MTILERVVVSACTTRLVNDKGRRILIMGITHLVVSKALGVDADFKQLNDETLVAHNPNAYILCERMTKLVRRSLCLDAEQLRNIPTERLAGWLLHYTPKWLRYRGDRYCLRSDIEQAISATIARA